MEVFLPYAPGRVVAGREGLKWRGPAQPLQRSRGAELLRGGFLQLPHPPPGCQASSAGSQGGSPGLWNYLKHFILLSYSIHTHYIIYSMHNIYNLTGEEASVLIFFKNCGYYIYKKFQEHFPPEWLKGGIKFYGTTNNGNFGGFLPIL